MRLMPIASASPKPLLYDAALISYPSAKEHQLFHGDIAAAFAHASVGPVYFIGTDALRSFHCCIGRPRFVLQL